MSNYTDSPNSCRVDFFKPSGKWYCTEAVIFPDSSHHQHPVDAFINALTGHFNNTPRFAGMTAVCLYPYNANSHPVMIKLPE